MRTLGTLLFAGTLLAQAPTYQKVATTMDIMHVMVIPSSDALFNVGAKEPANAKDWQDLRNQALILAESANLLLMPGRAVVHSAKAASKSKAAPVAVPADWAAAALKLRAAGKSAIAAIDKKDLDVLTGDVGDTILAACASCHDKYLAK